MDRSRLSIFYLNTKTITLWGSVAARWLVIIASINLTACLEFPNKYSKMPPGMWRGVLILDDPALTANNKPLDEKSLSELRGLKINEINSNELPFQFEVIYPSPDSFYIEIINSAERIRPGKIKFGRSLQTAKDTIEIHFPEYRSMIKALVEDRAMEGLFIDSSRGSYQLPFIAKQGEQYRFTRLKKPPVTDLTGEWAVSFGIDGKNSWPGVGQFRQDGNRLKATFTTETGDYRYLDGCVQDDKLYLSAFDGSHAFLFEGKIFASDSIIGVFKSGDHFTTYWKATPDKQELRDPFAILKTEEKEYPIQDILRDSFGVQSALIKENQPVVLEIMGTWCPNCKDAALFLKEIQQEHPEVQIISLAFERKGLKSPKKHLASYQKEMGLNYPVFYAGPASKDFAAQKLPFLSKVESFPSFFFFDVNNQLIADYSGFYGPATNEFAEQKKKLSTTIKSLKNNSKIK